MSDLETAINALVSRLDTVTSRLERLEKDIASGVKSASAPAPAHHAAPATSGSDDAAPFVAEWDELVDRYLPQYIELSQKIGDKDVIAQAQLVKEAIALERKILVSASKAKKPADSQLQNVVGPTGAKMGEIKALREKQAKSHKCYNHLSAISEGIDALSWVVVAPKPGPHVAEAKNGAQFYSNKILQEFKGKDQMHVDWVNTFVGGFLKDLQDYIKKFHTTGLAWNPKGDDLANIHVADAPAPSDDGPEDLPPPPGPAPDFEYSFNTNANTSDKPKGGAAALFAEINQKGEGGVTTGLKHVTKDMKKKPPVSSVVSAKAEVTTSSAPAKAAVTKPPKFALDGTKWVVEYQNGNRNIVIDQTEPRHTVYIYRCKQSTVQIKGKVNSIIFDECEKCGLVFESAIASVEIVNCKSVEVQVTGKVPSFAIDKTSGIQLYLSADSLDSEIVTAKSDQMNVLIPNGDDLTEMPIPEQYKTVVSNGKLVTHVSSHV